MTGANRGEWFDGRPCTIFAIAAMSVAPENFSGSAPPNNQYTHGAPEARASRPTSSLP